MLNNQQMEKIEYVKYVMGKDKRSPKERWSKPIYKKIGGISKRVGTLVKYVDGLICSKLEIQELV